MVGQQTLNLYVEFESFIPSLYKIKSSHLIFIIGQIKLFIFI